MGRRRLKDPSLQNFHYHDEKREARGRAELRKYMSPQEIFCVHYWNVRSMNQGKLEVVKQEMARVNINTLGISELKWTRMGEINSDDHYIYYCWQASLRSNGVALIVNKRV